jgi:YVTN family beta-propeller protein
MINTGPGMWLALLALPGVVASLGAGPDLPSRVRQPVALSPSDDGSRLFVANGRSGSLSVIDVSTSRVASEIDLGRRLADVALLPGGSHLLAVDPEGDALILVDVRPGIPRAVARRAVSPDPVRALVLPGGRRCVVASRGSRRLTSLEIGPTAGDGAPVLGPSRALDLPFRPLALASLRGGDRLVVADAFGGRLAVVDPAAGTLIKLWAIPGHNIRGLAASPDGRWLGVAYQVLERSARTKLEDIHFGALMRNTLRVFPVEGVLGPGTDDALLDESREADLDGFGNGAGDPAALAFDRDGGVVVALAGVGQLAVSGSPTGQLRRVAAGRRPWAVALSPDGQTAYVADAAEDVVWAVGLPSGHRRRAIPLGPRPEPDAAERGERLFFDARLSHDRWMSCHSCHSDGQTNGLLADTLGDGTFGTPKLVPPLLGVGSTGPWAWNGSAVRLEDQVRKSVETTMQGTSPTDDQVADLTAYLRSLAPPKVLSAAVETGSVERGRAAFHARRCDVCHAPPTYTAPGLYDVGLTDGAGLRKFNPPSLRGVGARQPLLHDGRAATLEDVFLRVGHPRGTSMSPTEAADLAAFLRTL